MYEAVVNKVILLYLPAHSTHATQPLDVVIFSILKAAYRRETENWASFDISTPIAKQNFLRSYEAACQDAFDGRYIRKAFSTTGIYPLDRRKVLGMDVYIANDTGPRLLTPPRPIDGSVIWTPEKGQDNWKQGHLKPCLAKNVQGRLAPAPSTVVSKTKEAWVDSEGQPSLPIKPGWMSLVRTLFSSQSRE
jgi:hypothetical protein